jgi:hypothetical protein
MKFKQYLINEGFNLNKPVVISKGSKWWRADFKVNGKIFYFIAEANHYTQDSKGNKINVWEVTFSADRGVYGSTTALTGEMGTKAMEVFSYVATSLDKFIKEENPVYFTFIANKNEQSREKLYNKLAKMIAKKYKYELKTSSYGETKRYTFKLKQ